VPESRHSGFNGTNGNRHPGSSVLSPTSLSANPSLHSSLRLKNNVPEKVNVKIKRQNQNVFWFFSLSLGRESRHDRDVVAEFGAPGMGDTKPERRWRLR